MQIAIDGPAGAGKSTIARKLAKRLNYKYVDTGAIYRAFSYYFFINNIEATEKNVKDNINKIKITLSWEKGIQKVYLNGKNVTEYIRQDEISMLSSKISSYKCVRQSLINFQRNIADKNNVVMDGRDIGTVILPEADFKFFITASLKKRALRRFWQLKSKGKAPNFKEIIVDLKKRDRQDRTRRIAPLKMAEDAVLIDNTNLTLSSTLKKMTEHIKK